MEEAAASRFFFLFLASYLLRDFKPSMGYHLGE